MILRPSAFNIQRADFTIVGTENIYHCSEHHRMEIPTYLLHSYDGYPALSFMNKDGNRWKYFSHQWFNEGKIHRVNGPASIRYNGYGNRSMKKERYADYYFFLNGTDYTDQVRKYFEENNIYWRKMDNVDYDIMWATIL